MNAHSWAPWLLESYASEKVSMLRITTETKKGKTLLRLEGKIAGPHVATLEQCWRELTLATPKAKFSVDHFDMILDYGTSENGHNQLRRVVIDMAGGFALVSLHYRLESELSDYREVEK